MFWWLVDFINKKNNGQKYPEIEISNLHLILISAEYLEMNDLVNYCVKYISENINSVIALGEGVNSYKSNIAKKIAKIITIENLDRIHD